VKEKDAVSKTDKHQMMLFVEREDGSIAPVQTGSYMVENYLDDFWVKRRHLEETALEELAESRISPVAYHMKLTEMAPADVAVRTGIRLSRVKKHMNPKHFGSMKIREAARYADVFGIRVSDLFSVFRSDSPRVGFVREEIDHPYVTIIRCIESETPGK